MIRNHLNFKNSYWGCKIELKSGVDVELQILSGESPLDMPFVNLAESLVEEIDAKFEAAIKLVLSSGYKEDVEIEGCLKPTSLQLHSLNDYRLWFELGNSNRQLGVSFKNGEFYDIYCESP